MKGSVDTATLVTPEGLGHYGGICAWALARAHARSGDSVAISAHLGTSDAFDGAIADFSETYADVNAKDYAAYLRRRLNRGGRLAYLERGRPALVAPRSAHGEPDPGWLFVSTCGDQGVRPLLMNATSLMLTRRYRAGGGTLPYFGSHRIRHATATLLVNNGMPLDEVSRYLGHSSTDVTRRYARQTPDALGRRAAEALARAGVTGG